jgi:hypothetical protein
MPQACGEKDRLRDAYHEAIREVAASSCTLSALPFGLDVMAALKNAEVTQRAADAARLAYEQHGAKHG